MSGERTFMERCMALAGRARGATSPNPVVGAVIVDGGRIVAEGLHEAAGRPHAEPAALAALGGRAEGATMYVNLEPCCHQGRTPPCTDALLESGLRRVVVGMVDPNPLVSGRGIRILREAGIEVEVGLCESECRRLNAAYVKTITTGLPLVRLKAAATLDGRIASVRGESRWITGPEARAQVHRMRHRADAVLVGSGTLLADDPALDTRMEGGLDATPVILDTRLRCPEDARVLSAGRPPLIYCSTDAPRRSLPATVVRVPRGPGGLDLRAVLRDIAARGMNEVLVEGGGTVHRSMLQAGLADELLLFLAPRVLAGGPGFVAGPGLALGGSIDLRVAELRRVGQDVLIALSCLREGS